VAEGPARQPGEGRWLDSAFVAWRSPPQDRAQRPQQPQRQRRRPRMPPGRPRALPSSRSHRPQVRQRVATARRQGQVPWAMRAARKQPPPPRKGCLPANHRPPRPPRPPPGLPGPRAPARNAPPGRTTGHRDRRPRAHDGTRPSPGPRPDLGSRPAAPLRTRCRMGPAASSDRRSGRAHRHARQASARIVPSGPPQRQPEVGILSRRATRERGGNQRLGQNDLRRRACSPARGAARRARRPVLGSQLGLRCARRTPRAGGPGRGGRRVGRGWQLQRDAGPGLGASRHGGVARLSVCARHVAGHLPHPAP